MSAFVGGFVGGPRRGFVSVFTARSAVPFVGSTGRRAFLHRSTVSMAAPASLYDIKMKDVDGNVVDFGSMKGKVVLAMNVACFCGMTKSGYNAMKNIKEKYGDKVEAIAFPSNEFGMQEPGSAEEIKSFVASKFGSPDILIMEKGSVKGPTANPVFKLAREAGMGEPSWNFDGRLIFDKTGKLQSRLTNSASETDLEKEVEKYV